MSSGDWKTISTRCKTGFFQEIASNTQVSCNNSQALEPPAIGIPNFCIMLYTGPVLQTTFATLSSTGVSNAFCNNTNDKIYTDLCGMKCTVPCRADGDGAAAWQDWYVLDDLLATATAVFGNSTYPQTVDTTGAVGMGIAMGGDNLTSGTSGDMKGMQGPYGSIDISFGIVPLHTHDIENKGITQVPGPDTVAAALQDDVTVDASTVDASLNIEHYHALPAIYLATEVHDEKTDVYTKIYAAQGTDASPGQFFTLYRTSSSGGAKPRLYEQNSVKGCLVYAMDTSYNMQNDAPQGGGYVLNHGGLPNPFPFSDYSDAAADLPLGMTWKNWQSDGTKLENNQSVDIQPITVDTSASSYITAPTEKSDCNDWFGVEWDVINPDSSSAWRDNGKIIVDICLNSVVTTAAAVEDYTNVATSTQSKDGLLSSGELGTVKSLEQLGGNMNDETDIPNKDGNLGYRSFGAFYIIYYPQIGNL